jgi:hypothetical protein
MIKIVLFFFICPVLGFCQNVYLEDVVGVDLEYYSQIIDSDWGDLDGDSIAEGVLVVNVLDSIDFGAIRDVIVIKQNNNIWSLWKSSSSAVLGSADGGVFGDPFQAINIEDNRIYISHMGGSNWRWSYTDEYSFVNDQFILISHFSYWGSLCDEKADFDFDLKSGKIIYSVDKEECPEGFGDNSHLSGLLPISEEFLYPNLKINFKNRYDSIINIVSPNHGFEMSL